MTEKVHKCRNGVCDLNPENAVKVWRSRKFKGHILDSSQRRIMLSHVPRLNEYENGLCPRNLVQCQKALKWHISWSIILRWSFNY